MIASNLVKRIHPICAQSKPNVPYLSTDVLNIVLTVLQSCPSAGCLIIVSFLCSSPCQRNSLADFAHANSLCTRGAIGKYQTTFTGPPLVLVPSSDGPSLYRGASHLDTCPSLCIFLHGIICNHWNTRGFFQPRG